MTKNKILLPCRSYPFQTSDLAAYKYRNYQITGVYESLSRTQQEAVIQFWLDNQALSSYDEARERSAQVCYLITDANTGGIVGVTTFFPNRVGEPSMLCLTMRMFIAPAHRRSLLATIGVAITLVFAATHLNDGTYAGVVNVNENSKLARTGSRKRFADGGYELIGQSFGKDVWLFDFQKHEFVDS